ncbi:MAG: GTPase HflX [Deltaproteobacteria bacterium]|nr:GTPase HflX [Deltaproteobacteria bacterium]
MFRFKSDGGARPTAVVVGVQLPGVDPAEHASSLAELERLAKTLGLDPIGRVIQRRAKLAPGKVLGDGKLKELAEWTGGPGEVAAYEKPGAKKKDEDDDEEAAPADGSYPDDADPDDGPILDDNGQPIAVPDKHVKVVVVDHELSPTQQRNLEKATEAEVLDRTSVILEIFHRHARTREARLQVEIAKLKYLAPRLREGGGGGDRVRGGVGGKGAGESALELDRRKIRDRIAELGRELALIEGNSQVRRSRRSDLPTVALVGYTNAGKSSLMRALTGSEVYVADKLFATLDTTVRVLVPRSHPPVLVSDTVGFIKKLPHDLVASFRSTLEEAADADLLLHVVDASDAAFRDHMQVTGEVLGEIGVKSASLLLLNKIDRVDDETRAGLALEYPDAVQLSAKRPDDVMGLRDRIVAHFEGALEDAELHVPWAAHRLVHVIHENCRVIAETHDDNGTLISVRAPSSTVARLRDELAKA